MSTQVAGDTWKPWMGVALALTQDGMTGIELAQKLGWEPSKVSRLINGKLKRFDVEELVAVAAAQNRMLAWYVQGPKRADEANRAKGVWLTSTRAMSRQTQRVA